MNVLTRTDFSTEKERWLNGTASGLWLGWESGSKLLLGMGSDIRIISKSNITNLSLIYHPSTIRKQQDIVQSFNSTLVYINKWNTKLFNSTKETVSQVHTTNAISTGCVIIVFLSPIHTWNSIHFKDLQ